MREKNSDLQLPDYYDFMDSIAVLKTSASGLHGLMCGFLCARADVQGERHLRAMAPNKDEASRDALVSMFSLYSGSQQRIASLDFEFNLLLPPEEEPLVERMDAFRDWCEGFVVGLELAGMTPEQLFDEEAQEALQHIKEFAELDSDEVAVSEEDERSLMEVTEYTRMAVLRLHADLQTNIEKGDPIDRTH